MPLGMTSNEQATQTLIVGLRRMYDSQVDSILFRNNEFLALPGIKRERSRGGDAYRWAVHTAGNASVRAMAEGAVAAASGVQTYVYAGIAYSTGYFDGTIGITGHMRDAATDEASVFRLLDDEFSRFKDDLMDFFTGVVIGAGAMGVQLAVDSTGTYAGVDRAVVTGWASEENATSGDLAADIDLLHQELVDAERRAPPSFWLTSPTQGRRYSQRAASAGGINVTLQSQAGAPVNMDLRPISSQSAYLKPIIEFPDLLNTIWLGLNTDNGRWRAIEHRPFQLDPLGRTGDVAEVQGSIAILVVCRDSQKQGKITGLATG